MELLKICGLAAFGVGFCTGIASWIESAERESVLGIIRAYILIAGSMLGSIYMLNN